LPSSCPFAASSRSISWRRFCRRSERFCASPLPSSTVATCPAPASRPTVRTAGSTPKALAVFAPSRTALVVVFAFCSSGITSVLICMTVLTRLRTARISATISAMKISTARIITTSSTAGHQPNTLKSTASTMTTIPPAIPPSSSMRFMGAHPFVDRSLAAPTMFYGTGDEWLRAALGWARHSNRERRKCATSLRGHARPRASSPVTHRRLASHPL
jgi:hypothetical protein